jgi:hypothetical protein
VWNNDHEKGAGMNLIRRIEIRGFRSLASVEIDSVGEFACLVGTNNSGKSNVLRALSLFFTDEPEPGKELDQNVDFYSEPRSKKRKQIEISVTFQLPDNFHFPEKLYHLRTKLGRKFTIRRRWRMVPFEWEFEISRRTGKFKRLDPEAFYQFSNLIAFRYIQNRIIPADVLKLEAPKFRDAVIKRLRRRKAGETDRLLKEITDAAENVIDEASEIATQHISPIRRLVMGTPAEAPSLLALSGFGAEISTGALIRDDSLGAGSQAYIMFLLLKTIDTSYGGTFGWRQGVVWAVEEPESSLHKDLEQKLAIMLRSWSEDEKLRLQVLATTHSETIITAATKGFLVELDEARTIVKPKEIPELVFKAATAGISGPMEPMLCFPTNPVVLVEGPMDRMILEEVAARTHTACGMKFVCLHELDPSSGGSGVDTINAYLKQHGQLAQNRASDSPVIVLFDHDVEDEKLRLARKYYGANGDRRVLRMNVTHADRRVSESIRGIERFYPKKLFVQARLRKVVAVSTDQYGVVHIEKDKLTSRVKNKLAQMLVDGPISWSKHLRGVLEDVQSAALVKP